MRHSSLRSIILVGVLIAACVALGPSPAIAATRWGVTPVTLGPYAHVAPQVSGTRIVWLENSGPNGSWQVFTQKLGANPTPVRLTSDSFNHYEPQVSGDRIAWGSDRYYDQEDAYMDNLMTRKIGVDAAPKEVVWYFRWLHGWRVSGDRLVWIGSGDYDSWLLTRKMGVDAHGYLLMTAQEALFGEHIQECQVSGDRVVWSATRRVGPSIISSSQVFTQKVGVDAAPVQLTDDGNDHTDVQVSGDRVAWVADDGSGHTQVFTRKMGTDPAPVKVTSSATWNAELALSGDRLVWSGTDTSGHFQIFTRKMGFDAAPVQLTSGTGGHRSPQVSGDRIVWRVYDSYSGDSQVYTRKMGTDSAAILLAAATGTYSLPEPVVAGDLIVWATRDQICRAKPFTTPAIARSPGRSSVTIRHRHGVGRYTLSATLRDTDGTRIIGKSVFLQTSANGSTNWKNTYSLWTNATGHVSKSFKTSRRVTRYYRWYVPDGDAYSTARTRRQTIRVR